MQRMTLEWPWTVNVQKYSAYTKYLYSRGKCWSVSLYNQPFFETQVCRKSEYTEYSENDLTHLNVQSALCTQGGYPRRPNFGPVSLYDQSFLRYTAAKNRKKWEIIRITSE